MIEFVLIVALIVLGIVAQAATPGDRRDENGWGTGPMSPEEPPCERSWEWGKPIP